MTEQISLRNKITKMYKKNETAGNIYIHFIKNKPENEKRDAIKIFLELSCLKNKDLSLRSKAIAILCFFGDMCCIKNVEEYYKDGVIVCNFKNEIHKILEDNCNEFISKLKATEFNEIFYEIIPQLLHSINSYRITSKSVPILLELLDKKLKLTETYKNDRLNMRDLNLYEQMTRIRKNIL